MLLFRVCFIHYFLKLSHVYGLVLQGLVKFFSIAFLKKNANSYFRTMDFYITTSLIIQKPAAKCSIDRIVALSSFTKFT